MAEFLIYDKDHWMDKLNQAEYDEHLKNKHFAQKFLARFQKGDIIEVRPDGFWVGPKARGFDREAFRVVSVPGVELDMKWMEQSSTKDRRYSISVGIGEKVKVVSSMTNLVITDKGV